MGKISGMQRYAEQFAQAKVEATQRLISKYMIDTLQMTLHHTEGWVYDRIMRLTEAWQQTQKEYTPALNMNREQAERQVCMHRNTAGYRFERVKKETGLDPQCFYDLVALLRKIGDCV